MTTVLEETSTITAKGQTTIPKSVRQALGVGYGGKIAFRIDDHGVSVRRVEADADDPALGSFLDFLGRDIGRHPEAIKALSPALVEHLAALTDGIGADPDEAIVGEVDL